MMLLAIKGLHVQPDVGLNATQDGNDENQGIIRMQDVLQNQKFKNEQLLKNSIASFSPGKTFDKMMLP